MKILTTRYNNNIGLKGIKMKSKTELNNDSFYGVYLRRYVVKIVQWNTQTFRTCNYIDEFTNPI